MTQVNGRSSLAKTNLYRAGVDQQELTTRGTSAAAYCRNLVAVAPPRLVRDRSFFQQAPSPDPAAAPNLFDFLTQRLHASYELLGCAKLLNRPND